MDATNAINIAVPFIARFEGFSPAPYLDAGSYAIGYGNHFYEDGSPVTQDDDAITQDRATQLLTFYAAQVGNTIAPMLMVPVSDNLLAALIDLGYNWGTGSVGNSRLLQLINLGSAQDQVQAQWQTTATTSQGIPNSDLVARRQAESQLAFSGDNTLGTTVLLMAGLFIVLFIYFTTKKAR